MSLSRRRIPSNVEQQVRFRAVCLCEYCHAAEKWQYVKFTVDHVIPAFHGGEDELENLALACFHCNRRKSAQLAARHAISQEITPLFHPRRHRWQEHFIRWQEHFIWSSDGLLIIGLTPPGPVTIETLALNRERAIVIRKADSLIGRHPPEGDPIQ